MKITKLIADRELTQFAKFCDDHTIIEGTYCQAFLKSKDKTLNRFVK